MKRIFFIDLENVKIAGLDGIEKLSVADRVIFFHGVHYHRNEISDRVIEKAKNFAGTVEIVPMLTYERNAMDFQISTYLGYMVGQNQNSAKFYIVSQDKGYRATIEFVQHIAPEVSVEQISGLIDVFEQKVLKEKIQELLNNKKATNIVHGAINNTDNLKDYHNYLLRKFKENGEKIYKETKCLFQEVQIKRGLSLHKIDLSEIYGIVDLTKKGFDTELIENFVKLSKIAVEKKDGKIQIYKTIGEIPSGYIPLYCVDHAVLTKLTPESIQSINENVLGMDAQGNIFSFKDYIENLEKAKK